MYSYTIYFKIYIIKEELLFMNINKELLKGSTVILILQLLNEKSMYGYEMIKEIKKNLIILFHLKKELCTLFYIH